MEKRYTSAIAKLAGDASNRTVDFVISSATSDRVGDTISPNGWVLDNYLKNPIVLWGHDRYSLPIGKASNIRVVGGNLMATAQFATAEEYPLADTVFKLFKGGYLNAVSVGFSPIDYTFNDHGVDFIKQELLEFSAVTIPCNPDALAVARAKGIDTERLAPALGDMAKHTASLVERSRIEAAIVAATGHEIVRPEKAAISFAKFHREVEENTHRLRLIA